jgi:hypothetical protein
MVSGLRAAAVRSYIIRTGEHLNNEYFKFGNKVVQFGNFGNFLVNFGNFLYLLQCMS